MDMSLHTLLAIFGPLLILAKTQMTVLITINNTLCKIIYQYWYYCAFPQRLATYDTSIIDCTASSIPITVTRFPLPFAFVYIATSYI